MVELTKSVITRENDTWVWGKTYSRNSENNPLPLAMDLGCRS